MTEIKGRRERPVKNFLKKINYRQNQDKAVVILQLLSKANQGSYDIAFYSFPGNAHFPGYFFMVEALEAAQAESRLLLRWERINRIMNSGFEILEF